MKVLITGATGFIGSNLVSRLVYEKRLGPASYHKKC